ncbi:MAG: PAS domain-containing protein [Bacteroidota bacterium]
METLMKEFTGQLKSKINLNYFMISFSIIGFLSALYTTTWLVGLGIFGSLLIVYFTSKLAFKQAENELRKSDHRYAEQHAEIKKLKQIIEENNEFVVMAKDLKMSNELLQEANDELGNIFNKVEEVLFSMDTVNFRIIQVSAACIRVYGYTPIEFISEDDLWLRTIHIDDKQIIEENYKKLHDGKTLVSKYRIIHKDGSIRWIEAKVIPTLGDNGEVIRIDGICNDITQKVQLEINLLEEKRKKQQQITAAVITAQENERSFLGEELHDNINPILATAKLYLECATSDDHKEKQGELIKDSRRFISMAMEEIRILSKTLVPPSLGEIGLVEAISDLRDSIEKVNNIKFITDWQNFNESLLSDKFKLTIYRIVQEQLNNIFKHAKAETIHISLNHTEHSLILSIKDDGVGFDITQKRNGVGIQNMMSRTELFNGKVFVNTAPGQGCELNVIFNAQLELPFMK